MQDIAKRLQTLGLTLIALSPQLPKFGLSIAEKHNFGFDILSDPDNAYAQALGLRYALTGELQTIYRSFGIDLPAFNGDESWTLPMPARIVVGQDGIVRHVDVDPDYTVRPDPEKTLEDVKKLTM